MPRNEAEKINTETDLDNVCKFVRDIMKSWPLGDIEGGELQDLALKYGLIKLKNSPPAEPCNEECTCVDYYDFADFAAGKVECYARTALLLAL